MYGVKERNLKKKKRKRKGIETVTGCAEKITVFLWMQESIRVYFFLFPYRYITRERKRAFRAARLCVYIYILFHFILKTLLRLFRTKTGYISNFWTKKNKKIEEGFAEIFKRTFVSFLSLHMNGVQCPTNFLISG